MNDKENLAQLVIELQSGNQDVFQKIYEQSYRKAYFTALKICKNEDDAEDVVQEAYIKLLKTVNELKNPDAFISWFNMIVANSARNMLRKNNPKLFASAEDEEYILDSIEDNDDDFHPTEDFEKDELRKEVMSLIDDLSDDKRTAVILYYYDEMTTKQIAESLEVNENTVKSRLVQAKKDLAKGVKELEKKNKKLRGIAPISILLWAIRDSAKKSAEAFTLSGGSAATYTAITATTGISAAGAGTLAASGVAAKVVGFTVAQKIISGIVIAGVVTGGAVGAKKVIEKNGGQENRTTIAAVETIEQTRESVDKLLNSISSNSKHEVDSEETTDNITNTESEVARNSNTNQSQTSVISAKTNLSSTEYAIPKDNKPIQIIEPITEKAEKYTGKNFDFEEFQNQMQKTSASSTTHPQTVPINIIVTKNGVPTVTIILKRNDGDTVTWNDVKAVVKSKGYDTVDAVYSGVSLPITVHAGNSYSIKVDIE